MPYRLIYSLLLDLGTDERGVRYEVIVNLNSQGGNRLKGGIRPRPPKVRIVDLRVGDEILYESRWQKVHGIEVFRETVLTDEAAAARQGAEGWLTKTPEGYVTPITSGGLRLDGR